VFQVGAQLDRLPAVEATEAHDEAPAPRDVVACDVSLPTPEPAEIAGAEEDEDLVAIRRRVHGEVNAKAREPQATHLVAIDPVLAVIERVGIERDLPNSLGADLVDRELFSSSECN
jgi:hypothetical protein